MSSKKIDILRDRAHMMSQSRQYFAEHHVLEVDCPIASLAASIDAHIDLFSAQNGVIQCYLHSSPEYGMKRLLANGIGDIYQLSHVFRAGERSSKHNPEFTMVEWYRLNISFEEMIQETAEFIRLFLGDLPFHIISYREAFIKFVNIDYTQASLKELIDCLHANHIIPYPNIENDGKDAILNLILGTLIEPHLGTNGLCALAYYPASQAALAKTCKRGDERAAERFEIYFKGIELANGYHELADPTEQHSRLIEANHHRQQLGKDTLPIDSNFLSSLKKGLPDCCGVAVGFDRLMMLRHQKNIEEVIPFAWEEA